MTMIDKVSADRHLFIVIVLMMIVGPVLWAVDRNIASLFLQLISLYGMSWLIMEKRHVSTVPRFQLAVLIAIALSIVLYLVPVPYELWLLLPGRTPYHEVLQASAVGMQWRSPSILQGETEKALWAIIPPIMVYVAVLGASSIIVRRLVYVAISVAVCQAFLGLLQYGSGVAFFDVVDSRYGNVATGTYLNRDHLAGFLEMVFPVMLALVAARLGMHIQRSRYSGSQARFLVSIEGHQSLVFGVAAILVMLCIVFTRSRTGLILTMTGLLFVLFVFYNRLGKTNTYGSYGTIIAVSMVLAVEIGLAPVLDRFSTDIMQDLRWEIYATSFHGIATFFPLGSGPGTFPFVYPAFQIPHHDYFINHAHNDYLEWIFEAGLLAFFIILSVFYVYFRNWKDVWKRGPWETSRYIQAGAGIGVFLMMLHTLVDFNLHKPVNAVYFAFFLAVFMRAGLDRGRSDVSVESEPD